MTPLIQFLSFAGCPLAGRAREFLRQAMEQCGLDPDSFEEIDVASISIDEHYRGWGSPTILINGKDVGGSESDAASSCRVYEGDDRVPAVALLVDHINQALQE